MIDIDAKWIYSDSSTCNNQFFKFRKEVNIKNIIGTEQISITADSRYYLYINGDYVGFGPIRAYPEHYYYDTYNISKYLIKGINVIAILLNHYDIDTFQYLSRRGGLLASIRLGNDVVNTDKTWYCAKADEYSTDTPRISCQQGYEEQYDANKYDGWKHVGYTSILPNAVELAPKEDGIHLDLQERTIPFLTKEIINTKCIREVSSVVVKNQYFSLNYESLFKREKFAAMPKMYQFDVGAKFFVVTDCDIELVYLFNDCSLVVNGTPYIKGTKIKFIKGENNLVFRLRGCYHNDRLTFVYRCNQIVELKNIYISDFFDPRDSNGELPISFYNKYQLINNKKLTSLEQEKYELELLNGNFSMLNSCDNLLVDTDIFAQTYKEQTKSIDNLDIVLLGDLSNDGDFLEINSLGKDIQLLVDFGDIYVGGHIIECIADDGVIIDFHNFEFIQPDGYRCYAEGMNNSMRYITKKGYQKHHSIIRRGFRYSYITLRNFSSIKLKLKMENSVYPQLARGEFFCDNYKLNEIVKVGKHTLKCCSEDTYTDCPTYEQVFWVGDGRNEALCDIVANGDPRLWKRSLVLAGQSLEYAPLTLSQVPSGWWNILPAWSFLWMRSVNEYSYYTNDKKGCLELGVFLQKNVDGILAHINNLGLFEINAWNMFDWADMDTPSDAIVTHLNCFAVQALTECSGFFRYIDNLEYAKICTDTAEIIKKATNKYLWNSKNQAFTDCLRIINGNQVKSDIYSQQTQTVAYISDICDNERKDRVKHLSMNPPENFVKAGSPFFEFFKLEMLIADNNEKGFLDEILQNWGFMLDKGCNTFWEMWTQGQQHGRLTRSHCHGWSSAPVYYLTEYVLGVKPIDREYKEVEINPHSCDLNRCSGYVPTPYGDIYVSWEKNTKQEIELKYSTPKNINVKIRGCKNVVKI